MELKHTFLTLAAIACFTTVRAQVKVGANPGTINAGSALEIEATNKGLLMPRVSLSTTTTWGLAGTAAAGMSVYNTNAGLTATNTTYPAMGVGEYYWDGTGWVSKKSGAQLGADNGLTVGYNSAGNVGLGGTLAKNTDVATAGKTMSFSGSGYVGVGTTAPKSRFSVSSDGGGMLGADDITIYTYGTSISPSIIEMSAAGSEASPANIANGTRIGSLGFGGRWNNAWNANITDIVGFYRGDGTTTLSDIRFATSNAERMRIEPNGNVGIGTSNPGAKLEVNSGTTAGAIKLVDGTQGADKVLTSDANGVGTWQTPTSYTATNGLTMSGSDVKLGGNLTETTTIAQGNNPMIFSGNSRVAISTTNSSVYPVAITQPLQTGINQPGLWIGGASGTAATNQVAFIGLNPNGSQGAWPISIGAQYINGSSGQGSADFFIATSQGGSAEKRVVVQNVTGNVGIGTTNPAFKLDVAGGTGNAVRIQNGGDLQFTADNDNTKGVSIYAGNGSGSSSYSSFFSFVGFGTGASSATINLTTGAVTGNSDVRLKENIHTINDVTSRLMKLRPVTYNYKTDKATVAPGLIAQEVDKVFPDVVIRPKTEKEYYSLYYQYFTPYLIKGFQEQQARIAQLEAQNAKAMADAASAHQQVAQLAGQIKEMQQVLGIDKKFGGAKAAKR